MWRTLRTPIPRFRARQVERLGSSLLRCAALESWVPLRPIVPARTMVKVTFPEEEPNPDDFMEKARLVCDEEPLTDTRHTAQFQPIIPNRQRHNIISGAYPMHT